MYFELDFKVKQFLSRHA